MKCCTGDATGKFFDGEAKKFAKKYRKRGLEKITRLMLEGIESLGVRDATILEVGCGVGGAHRRLLRGGASRVFATELSEAMIKAAKDFAEKEGLAEKIEYIRGDIAEFNGEIPEVEVTLHDKVICCYENYDVLLEKTLAKTNKIYAFVMPRNKWHIRKGFGFIIMFAKLLKWEFHPYFHPVSEILRRVEKAGFNLKYENTTFVWHSRVYSKD